MTLEPAKHQQHYAEKWRKCSFKYTTQMVRQKHISMTKCKCKYFLNPMPCPESTDTNVKLWVESIITSMESWLWNLLSFCFILDKSHELLFAFHWLQIYLYQFYHDITLVFCSWDDCQCQWLWTTLPWCSVWGNWKIGVPCGEKSLLTVSTVTLGWVSQNKNLWE